MKTPAIDRLYASVCRPTVAQGPADYEYVLWYRLTGFPIMVKVSAYQVVPRA